MSRVCENTEDSLLTRHPPDFTHGCVRPTLLRIRLCGGTGTGGGHRNRLWRTWRGDLFVTGGALCGRGGKSSGLRSLPVRDVSRRVFLSPRHPFDTFPPLQQTEQRFCRQQAPSWTALSQSCETGDRRAGRGDCALPVPDPQVGRHWKALK